MAVVALPSLLLTSNTRVGPTGAQIQPGIEAGMNTPEDGLPFGIFTAGLRICDMNDPFHLTAASRRWTTEVISSCPGIHDAFRSQESDMQPRLAISHKHPVTIRWCHWINFP